MITQQRVFLGIGQLVSHPEFDSHPDAPRNTKIANHLSNYEYPAHFLKTLDQPDQIWHHAVQEHLDLKARILLRCLYFVPNFTNVDKFFVDWFNVIIDLAVRKFNLTLSENEIKKAIRVLEGSFVDVFRNRVTYVNPSLRDYVHSTLLSTSVLKPLAECVQNRTQALWILNFVKSEIDNITGSPFQIYSSLADRCLVQNTSVNGFVSIYYFLDFAHEIAEKLDNRDYCNIVATEEFSNSLDLDIRETPKLFEELDINLYNLPNKNEFRNYLKKRFIAELEDTPFDREHGVSLLYSAEEHPNYMDDEELEALEGMANAVVAEISLPDYSDDSSDWAKLEQQIEILEIWSTDRQARYLKSEIYDYLAELEQQRYAEEESAREEYKIHGVRPTTRASYRSNDPAVSSQNDENEYRAIFEGLVVPRS